MPKRLLLLALLAGCSSKETWLAELVEARARVEEERAGAAGRWTPARPGNRYAAGDAVRTGEDATASLRLATGEELRLDPSTTLRLGKRPREVSLELGLAEVVAGDGPLRVETSFGSAVIDPRSHARVIRKGEGLEVTVMLGEALLDPEQGEGTRVAAGRTVRMSFGGAILEEEPPAAAPDAAIPEVPATPPAEGTIAARVSGGTVEQQPRGSAAFGPLPAGAGGIAPGTRVRVAEGADLRLEGDDGHLVIHGPAEAVVGPKEGILASVERGRVAFDARRRFGLELPGGALSRPPRAEAATRGEAAVGTGESHLHVAAGELEVRGKGRPVRLHEPESASLSRAGRVTLWQRSVERADVVIGPGESPVVHDPSPPTAVAVSFGKACPGGGVLVVGAGAHAFLTEGHGNANVLLPRGTHRYQVRCLAGGLPSDRVSARGTIRVLRDGGTKALPARPQKAVIDADGRRWSLVYGTLLPEISFRWPAARAGGPALLHLLERGQKQERVVPASGPSATIASGGLAEGTYEWWFSGADGRGPTSPRTELRVAYDSTSSSASIRKPAIDERWAATVPVAGEVEAGWRVEVADQELSQDEQRRFTTEVPAPEGGVLAIRLIHRQKGVQVYLRRDSTAAAAVEGRK